MASLLRLLRPIRARGVPCTRRWNSSDFAFPISLAKPGDNPRQFYEDQVKAGNIKENAQQMAAIVKLERVWHDLVKAEKDGKSGGGGGGGGGFFGNFFGGRKSSGASDIKGLYLYGGVGCGKTFIMDLFCACAPNKLKRRAHFHKFMLEVHERMHAIRKRGSGQRPDVASVAEEMIKEGGTLICFDEFNVTDVGDAVILRTLFDRMWECGAVVVSTSNRRPDELYKNGIQRELFVPCIKAIGEKCEVHDMDSGVDFRLLTTESSQMYVVTGGTPEGVEKARATLCEMFEKLRNGHLVRKLTLLVQGRKIKVRRSAAGVASFDFSELCSLPTGAADFLAIARSFHTIIIHDIPMLSMERLPEVRRLITLVDVLYDHKVKVFCSAAAEPFELFQAEKGAAQDEAFAFDRTASRLKDMRSEEYKSKAHSPPTTSVDGDTGSGEAPLAELRDTTLSPDDVDVIWRRYATTEHGQLGRAELTAMLEDVSLLKLGHRNVPCEAVDDAMKTMDEDGDDLVSKLEFQHFLERGESVWYY